MGGGFVPTGPPMGMTGMGMGSLGLSGPGSLALGSAGSLGLPSQHMTVSFSKTFDSKLAIVRDAFIISISGIKNFQKTITVI